MTFRFIQCIFTINQPERENIHLTGLLTDCLWWDSNPCLLTLATHFDELPWFSVHPIVEIRTRALDSLVQKVELGLVARAELASSNPPLVHHLLKLLHLGPPSTTTKPLLTLLLLLAEVREWKHWVSIQIKYCAVLYIILSGSCHGSSFFHVMYPCTH